VAILREQGVNSHVEMAYAFTEAGFEAVDVHMTDLQSGRARRWDFRAWSPAAASATATRWAPASAGRAASPSTRCWRSSSRPSSAADTFGLGVCNGCQMFAELADIIPGAEAWPRFTTNRSERFEARLSHGGGAGVAQPVLRRAWPAAGCRSRWRTARAIPTSRTAATPAKAIAAMRFVDNHGQPTERYPFNPNGSAGGLTAVTTADGRFTALMPHPERVFRNIQMSWTSATCGFSPWMRIWRNARKWVG
jgi:phosphoribosylformylglycinamidine synthase